MNSYFMLIKSEIESAQIYNELAKKFSSNYLLSERLKFLAKEEDLHQTIITRLFKDRYRFISSSDECRIGSL